MRNYIKSPDGGGGRVFDGLKEALAEDEKKAFDCTYFKRCLFANMGITPMFDTVEKIVECFVPNNDGLMPV